MAKRSPLPAADQRPIHSHYREDLAPIHDAGYGAIAQDAATRLIQDLSGCALSGGLVVDLGCESGTLAAALTGAGYRVLGFDVSEAMVAIARTRAASSRSRRASPNRHHRAATIIAKRGPGR